MVIAFALSLPGLALAVVLFALASTAFRQLAGSRLVPARLRRRPSRVGGAPSVSTVALDVFTGSVNTGKTAELEERSAEAMRRDEEGDAAPPRSTVDLHAGRAVIVLPKQPTGTDRKPGGRN
ncbi:hypothetical protein J5Y04_05380 [Kitasatospora sp. RG8]|uniref:DUF6191 domain-containing protein n=1 Tax=Kitasatospora sp. RG8 TaxID=2820815 RepID=UPI001AE0AB85|nr:DUF6191 domain-containing protein [Kitasatospora sp. RG8]MBP0448974.1 hypothetical protein [Kitasatospora sp. RG8]